LSGDGLYWPVRSRKPYTAAMILPFGGGRWVRSRVTRVGGVSVALPDDGIGAVTQPVSSIAPMTAAASAADLKAFVFIADALALLAIADDESRRRARGL